MAEGARACTPSGAALGVWRVDRFSVNLERLSVALIKFSPRRPASPPRHRVDALGTRHVGSQPRHGLPSAVLRLLVCQLIAFLVD